MKIKKINGFAFTIFPSLQCFKNINKSPELELYMYLRSWLNKFGIYVDIVGICDSNIPQTPKEYGLMADRYFKNLSKNRFHMLYGTSSGAKTILQSAHSISVRARYALILAGFILDFKFKPMSPPEHVFLLYGENDFMVNLSENDAAICDEESLYQLAQLPKDYAPIQMNNLYRKIKVMPAYEIVDKQNHTLSIYRHRDKTINSLNNFLRFILQSN